MNHKLVMERYSDSYTRVLKADKIFSIDLKIWNLNELEAQKIHRMISDIIDGVVGE